MTPPFRRRVGQQWVALLTTLAAFATLQAYAQAVSRLPSKKVPDQTPQARIPLANEGGIVNWQVRNDHTLYVQGQDRQWYKAVLMSSCYELPSAERLGFESNLDGSFDKSSAIRVGARSCPLASLTKAPAAPPVRKASAPPAPLH